MNEKSKFPNCIVRNKKTGMTHYGFCDEKSNIVGKYCGRGMDKEYEIVTRDINSMHPGCGHCFRKQATKRGGPEHWLYYA